MENIYYKRFAPIWKGKRPGKYLGNGSYGQVWELTDENDSDNNRNTAEAVKEVMVPPASAGGIEEAILQGLDFEGAKYFYEGMRKRALDEVIMMQRLSACPAIVNIKDCAIRDLEGEAGEVGWVIFIRMELLQPLKERLIHEGITPQELIYLGADLCEALEACAENGIVHRDVKPENIFYSSRDGKYKLGDFGISCYLARPTEGKGLPGTLTHMSPEVYRGEPFTPAGDLYAAGMVLYKILNDNRIPFLPPYPIPFSPAERERALGVRLQGAPVGPPTAINLPDAERHPTLRIDTNVDPAVKEVLQDLGFISQKAIASDPSERYQSAAEMREALEAVLKKYYRGSKILHNHGKNARLGW